MINVRCTTKWQKNEKWVKQLEVPTKFSGAGGGKVNDEEKDDRQNWDLELDMRYLEEGIDEENKHCEEC